MFPVIDGQRPQGSDSDARKLVDNIRKLEESQDYFEPDEWINRVFVGSSFHIESLLEKRYRTIGGNGTLTFRHSKDGFPKPVCDWITKFYRSRGLADCSTTKMLLSHKREDIELFERVWLCFEDNLLLSSPEMFIVPEYGSQIRKYFRYCISLLAWGGYTAFMKVHSKALNFIEKKALGIVPDEPPVMPTCFPGWDCVKQELVTGPLWLVRLLKRGKPLYKGEITRVAHFVNKRGYPSARKETQLVSAIEHHEKLVTAPIPVPPERLRLLEHLSKRIARRVDRNVVSRTLKRPEHVSLSNRSSFLFTREVGGRANEVAIEFTQWATKISDGSTTNHILGYKIFETQGLPRWKTCILDPLREPEIDLKFGDAFESKFIGTNTAGLNQNVGFQLIQCAYESLLNKGYIDTNGEVLAPGFMRTSCKAETGNKARIYTIQEWDRTIFLQPLGHFLTECLASLPEAEAGLKRSNVGWEWSNALKRKDTSLESVLKQFSLLTSDLETATDYCDHEVSRVVLRGFVRGLGLESNLYLKTAINLLTSGLLIVTKRP